MFRHKSGTAFHSLLFACLTLLSGSANVLANVSAEEAKKLNGELTPMGAERNGSADGLIPAWTGETPKAPAGFKPGDHHPDPYAGEKPLFVIDASNAAKYADHLTAAHLAMLKLYPDFKMPVYPTHRSATYPQWIYQAVYQNALHAKLTDDGEGVVHASGGSPFPIPHNAYEVMWNHKLRYRGEAVETFANSAVVNARGQYNLIKTDTTIRFQYSDPKRDPDGDDDRAILLLGATVAPPKLAGNRLLVHEYIDSLQNPRKAWIFLSGQRRVRRAPDIGYDAPVLISDSIAVVDNTDMFSGAMDRFNWKLLGKREIYIPYNAYALHSDKNSYDDILKPRHLNTDLLRYELHRVWVVEADLKASRHHRYAKRVFYLDEDSWQIAVMEQYDSRGELVSVGEGFPINYYENPLFWYATEVIYNLNNQSYYASGLDNQEKMSDFSVKPKISMFSPSSLTRMR